LRWGVEQGVDFIGLSFVTDAADLRFAREVASWYTSTHPQSHFRSRLMVARAGAEGQRITVADDELTIRQRDGRAEHRRIGSPAELLEILATYFALEFPPGTRFPTLEPAAEGARR